MLDAQPEACMLMMQEESETKTLVDRIVYYNQRALEMFGVQKHQQQLMSNQGVGQEEKVLEKRMDEEQPFRSSEFKVIHEMQQDEDDLR
jgi:PAS domain-containing protein